MENTANKILMAIGESFLSDSERALIPDDGLDNLYKALVEILNDRKVSTVVFDKLKAKALLDGVNLTESKKQYGSNIVIGFGVD